MKFIEQIYNWFEAATPAPTPANATTQLGCHIEECIETIEALNSGTDLSALHELADKLKAMNDQESIAFLINVNHVELNDGLCDTVVTATGSSHHIGYVTDKSLEQVISSNWSKFEDGKPVRDKNGKIQKGVNFFRPDLTPYSIPKILKTTEE